MTHWWRSTRSWLVTLLLVAAVACGGPPGNLPPGGGDPGGGDPGGGDPGGGDPGAIFEGRERFGGPLPDAALIVDLEAFKLLVVRDDVVWDSLARRERIDLEEQARFEADRAAVEDLVAANPALARVLETPDPDDPDVIALPSGEYLVTVRSDDGEPFQVLLQGQRDAFSDLLAARERFPTKQNQLELYATAYASLPEAVRTTLPSLTEVAAGDASDAAAAVAQVNAAVAGLLTSPMVAAAALPAGYPASPADELGADPDRRDWRTCVRSPVGLYRSFSWPLKYFQTSVKDQANRGTCTSFGLAAAIESITAMTQGVWVNVSEQHLYFQSRGIWQPNGTANRDGFMYANIPAAGGGYQLRAETQWTYNPSLQRVTTATGFENSCTNYDEVCSDTVHQGATVCVPVGSDHYCLLVSGNGPNASGLDFAGIPFPDVSTVLWEDTQGTDIPLDLVRYYLQTGHPILTSVRVNDAFRNPFNGFVGTQTGAGGGHVVLMVGFVTDEAILAHPTLSATEWIRTRAENSGGGFFIVKNSWGCSGDGGYLYLPVAWAEAQFERLRLPLRGPAPAFDSYVASLPPTLEITAPANGTSYSLSPLLDVRFTAYTDPFDCCTITWTSDKDGQLGTGREIDVSFAGAEPGVRTITARATRGDGKTVVTSITINLTTSAPNVSIVFPMPGQLFRDLEYTFVAEEFSGPNAPQPCSSYTWTSSVAGEGPWSSCTPSVTFTTTGPRTITVSLDNEFGQVGSDDVDVTVVERPDDGPPALSITSPSLLESFTASQRAYVAYSVVDPSPLPPTSIEWSISYGLAGDRLPITLITDPRPRPSRPSNQYFRPSDYVMPLCFHSTNPNLEPYVVRLTYTNAEGSSATARVPIFLNADPNLCIN